MSRILCVSLIVALLFFMTNTESRVEAQEDNNSAVEALASQNSASEKLQQAIGGETDATELLQTAVNRSSGTLLLPDGVLRISKPISINLDQPGAKALQGSAATTILMAGKGPAFLLKGTHEKSADPGGFEQRVWKRQRMPQLSGFAIEGMHPEADGIRAVGTMQLTVSGMHLRKLRHGIHLVGNNRNVIVTHCHIYENRGVGIFYDDTNLHQSNIVGCHISYCDQGGIVSRAGNVRNIHISGCDIESNMASRTAPTANVFIDCRGSNYGTAEVAISGCTIQHNDDGPDSANIRMIGASGSNDASFREGHLTIVGNVLSDVSHNIWLQACRGVTITGNTFWMGFEHNLLVEDCAHVVVGANNMDRNPRYAYGNSLDAKNQVVFRNTQDSTISGLHIAYVWNSPAALSLIDCDRFNVTGLTILESNVGINLQRVTRSRFSNCMIESDAPAELRRVVEVDSSRNYFDRSLADD